MKLIEAEKSEKKDQLERLLEKGIVMVFVDARRKNVEVPAQYRGNLQLPLNVSYTYQIPDFKVLDDRIEVSLTFADGEFFCRLPFDALYVYTSQIAGESVVFPEDVPPELIHTMAPAPKSSDKKSRPKLPKTIDAPVPEFSVVEGQSEEPKKPSKKKKTNHLKLVQ